MQHPVTDLPAVPAPDEQARRAAVARHTGSRVPRGGLGTLAELGVWLAGVQGECPPSPPSRARVVVFAGDHGVAAAGVSRYPAGSTADAVTLLRDGAAPVGVVAPLAEAGVRVVDVALDREPEPGRAGRHRIRRGSGRIDVEDALTERETADALAVGRALADDEVDSGADLLIPGSLGVGASTPADTLVAAVTGTEPVAVVGRGSGIDDDAWMRKAAAVRDALWRTKGHRDDPAALLRIAGGADLAALAGFCAQAAVRRTPVLLDGPVVAAAALLAHLLAPGASAWWLAAQRSTEPAAVLAFARLDLAPAVDLGVRLADGTGAVAVVPLLRMAARLTAELG